MEVPTWVSCRHLKFILSKPRSRFLLQACSPQASPSQALIPLSSCSGQRRQSHPCLPSSYSLNPVRNPLSSTFKIYPKCILFSFSAPSSCVFLFWSVEMECSRAGWIPAQGGGLDGECQTDREGCRPKNVREECQTWTGWGGHLGVFTLRRTPQGDEGVLGAVGWGEDILAGEAEPSRPRRASALGSWDGELATLRRTDPIRKQIIDHGQQVSHSHLHTREGREPEWPMWQWIGTRDKGMNSWISVFVLCMN